MGLTGGLLWALSRAALTPLIRYELQLRTTSGQIGVTFAEIAKSREKYQGVILEVVQLLPPVVVSWIFGGICSKLVSKLPERLLLDETLNDLPVIWLSKIVVHPIATMHQLQATMNRETGVIEAWDCLNRTPRFMFQGLVADIIYTGLVRILWYFLRKCTPIPTEFIPYVIASWIFYPLITIKAHQMEAAMFSENQSIVQSANSIYGSSGITGFWAGSMVHTCNQTIPFLVLLSARKLINI